MAYATHSRLRRDAPTAGVSLTALCDRLSLVCVEGALLSLAMKAGVDPAETTLAHRRLSLIPFESDHGFMASANFVPDSSTSFKCLAPAAADTATLAQPPQLALPATATQQHPEGDVQAVPTGCLKVYVKGAPEKIFAMCTEQVERKVSLTPPASWSASGCTRPLRQCSWTRADGPAKTADNDRTSSPCLLHRVGVSCWNPSTRRAGCTRPKS